MSLVEKTVFSVGGNSNEFPVLSNEAKTNGDNNWNQVRLHVIPDFVLELSMVLVVFVWWSALILPVLVPCSDWLVDNRGMFPGID